MTAGVEQSIADAYNEQMKSVGSNRGVSSPDLATRRAALARVNEAFDAAAPVTATLLATLVDVENRDAAAHGFRDAAERKYVSLGLTGALVDQTLAAVAAGAPAYRRYEQGVADHAARTLGVSPILSAEQDLASSPPASIPLIEGSQLILEAFRPLGPEYSRRFALLLDPPAAGLT